MIATGSGSIADVLAQDAARCASGCKEFSRPPADCEALWYFATVGRKLAAVHVSEIQPGIRQRRFIEARQLQVAAGGGGVL